MKKLFTTLTLLIVTLTMTAQAPAFPGAEGHGRYTTGGRGGTVVHVTNLNNSGAGSFRQAVSGESKKIVVFDVGGVIALESDVNIGANTTILGQTAPAPGITLRYYTLKPKGNVIVRFIRSRRGQEKNVNDGADAITAQHYTNMIFDHCSFSWSIDEVASFYDNNNFTMQWCTIGESLNNAGHGKGAHGYGGIWGGKLASFHHNLICHVSNRSPRFCGARYDWDGYTNNTLYSEYKWANTVQAENVDFRNCVIYNANGCYGGPGGGKVNIVNNYYKSGPAAATSKVTEVTVGAVGNSEGYPKYWGMTSRYFIDGNVLSNQSGNSVTDFGWSKVIYDKKSTTSGKENDGTFTIDGEQWSLDPNHYNGEQETYKKNSNGKDCIRIRLDSPTATGDVTTHTAKVAFTKVLGYAGASLIQDNVDERYMKETKNGTATYSGSVTKKAGRIDLVSDVNGYTEANFGTGSREAGFDSDKDGIPDAWERANGLNPNNSADALLTTLDPLKYYTNIEVYANSLVQDIMLSGNADAQSSVSEYYPAYTKEDGTAVEAINIQEGGSDTPSQESKTYTIMFNGSNVENPTGFFTWNDAKHNFNAKFQGTYDGLLYTSGLKMEGATLVQFTTDGVATVTIVQSTWKNGSTIGTIKLDGSELDVASATTPAGSSDVLVYTVVVGEGEHKITRGSAESGIFYVEVTTAGGDATGITTTHERTTNSDYIYSLSGQRVGTGYRGLVIKNGRKQIQR